MLGQAIEMILKLTLNLRQLLIRHMTCSMVTRKSLLIRLCEKVHALSDDYRDFLGCHRFPVCT